MNDTGECFRIAGAVVRVEWNDPELRAGLRPAFAHRATDPVAADLVISAGRESRPDSGPASGLIMRDTGGELVVEESEWGLSHRLELATARAVFTCRDPARLPVHERAAPFRLILQSWLRTRGVHLLHAGAVGQPGTGAVLLAAPGGGGKSNTFLSCLASSSLSLLGEDFVAVTDPGSPCVASVYGAAKLHPADLGRFPSLTGDRAGGNDVRDGKILFDLAARHAARFADQLPLRAILVLRITAGSGSRLVPASPAEAVRAMLTSLLMVLPAARRPLFEFTAQLARDVPAYRLELGGDPEQVAAAIEEFLRS